MREHEGGCLCNNLRYRVAGDPIRVTVCHCKFCQRATGGAYMVQPVFEADRFQITQGSPKTYAHTSTGSGHQVLVHFCEACVTKLFLTFDRFPGFVGLYAGSFDDPDWFMRGPENSRHVFVDAAQRGTILPPHVNTFAEHAIATDGTAMTPTVYEAPHIIERGPTNH